MSNVFALRPRAAAGLSLQERLEFAEERILQPHAALIGTDAWWPPRAWGLSKNEAIMLRVMAARAVATREAILIACQDDPLQDLPDPSVCDVYAWKMRRKLSRHGFAFEAINGVGFRLDDDSRRRLRRLMAGESVDEAAAAPPSPSPKAAPDCRLTAAQVRTVRGYLCAGHKAAAIARLTGFPPALVAAVRPSGVR